MTGDAGAAKVSVLLGNGDGTLQPPVDYAVDVNAYASVAIGDLNGDGKPDLVASNHFTQTVPCCSGQTGRHLPARNNYRVGTVHLVANSGDLNYDTV